MSRFWVDGFNIQDDLLDHLGARPNSNPPWVTSFLRVFESTKIEAKAGGGGGSTPTMGWGWGSFSTKDLGVPKTAVCDENIPPVVFAGQAAFDCRKSKVSEMFAASLTKLRKSCPKAKVKKESCSSYGSNDISIGWKWQWKDELVTWM